MTTNGDFPVKIDNLVVTPVRNDEDKSTIGAGPGSLPFDLPAWVSVTRHMRDGALVGWTLDIQEPLHDAKISLKIGRGPWPLVIVLNGEEIARVAPKS